MKKQNLIFFASLFLLLHSGPSKAQTNLIDHLPAGSDMIIQFNLGQLGKKMSWTSLMEREAIRKLTESAGPNLKSFLQNPASTGIDFKPSIFLALKMNFDDPSREDGSLTLVGRISQESVFSQFLQTNAGKPVSVIREGNGNYYLSENYDLAWNNNLFVLKINMGPRTKPDQNAEIKEEKKTDKPKSGEKTDAGKRQSKTEQVRSMRTMQALLNAPEKAVQHEDPLLKIMMEGAHDIVTWTNGEAGLGKLIKGAPFDKLNMNLIGKPIRSLSLIDFEDGQIVFQKYQLLPDSIAVAISKLTGKKFNPEFLERIPIDEPMFLMNYNLDMDGMEEMIGALGLRELFKDSTKKMDIPFQDFREALGGDLMVAMDMKPGGEQSADKVLLFARASVKDAKKMQVLIDSIKAKMNRKLKENEDPDYLLGMEDGQVYLTVGDGMMEKFRSMKPDITGYQNIDAPVYAQLDIFSLVEMASKTKKSEESNQQGSLGMIETMFSGLDKYEARWGKMENSTLISNNRLTFVDKGTNSLVQIMDMIEMIASILSKKETENPEGEEQQPE